MGLIPSCNRINVQAIQATHRSLDSSQSSMEGPQVRLDLRIHELLGQGHFSHVYRASLWTDYSLQKKERPLVVAVKKTTFNPHVQDREIAMLRAISHVNIIRLEYFYWSTEDKQNGSKELNLVLEYLPTTVNYHQVEAARKNIPLPLLEIKLWCYQLFRAIHYMHSIPVCHRDIKPSNLLLKREIGLLKVGDFGSAKQLDAHSNIPYIVSRWYRAPELILKNKKYNYMIDMWACGCVLGELLKGGTLFPAERDERHLLMIINTLGSPNQQQIEEMHPKDPFQIPCRREPRSWKEVLPKSSENGGDLVNNLLQWSPNDRFTADEAVAHPFFDSVRDNRQLILPNGNHVEKSIFD